ncbi:MAG TPA: ZIP family metal transporter [Conexivisphaerales archaeon]|nr:ZIP family metal transporter [Conexivisphaerales archaeon]
MDLPQLLLLGALSGFTIFLGLPLALLQGVSSKKKGFLNAFAVGILVFLIVDVLDHAWGAASQAALDAFAGRASIGSAAADLLAVFGGIAVGLLGLVLYESRYMARGGGSAAGQAGVQIASNDGSILEAVTLEDAGAYRLALMIAVGIGAHNFSEGLAIGQSYAAGSIGLALILIVGFGAHNATEGFGISGPLTRLEKRPSVRFLATAGLVGGGPTFLGTVVGSLVGVSTFTYVLFLSIAGGALVFVSLLMYGSGRRQTTNRVLMAGIFVGLCAGFLTDLLVTLGGA